ncbi:MAG: phosphoribosylanthranilate isomerase [Thermomicrobium sp.]|nr:phosphoribosylanthranilate isomerase [Thermomicrobium sp.]
MPGLVKLCGMRTPEDALAAAEAGADLIGLVFAPSRRQVTLEQAAAIVESVRRRANAPRVVGLFVDAPPEEVIATAATLALDAVQLHGNESPDMVARIGWPVIKAVRLAGGETAETARARVAPYFAGKAQPLAVLLDAYHPQLPGGTGRTVDWTVAAQLAQEFPVILAGGLRPETVAEAIACVRPRGVDVSSGVERGGQKDPVAMRAFVAAARAAFARVTRSSEARSGGTS